MLNRRCGHGRLHHAGQHDRRKRSDAPVPARPLNQAPESADTRDCCGDRLVLTALPGPQAPAISPAPRSPSPRRACRAVAPAESSHPGLVQAPRPGAADRSHAAGWRRTGRRTESGQPTGRGDGESAGAARHVESAGHARQLQRHGEPHLFQHHQGRTHPGAAGPQPPPYPADAHLPRHLGDRPIAPRFRVPAGDRLPEGGARSRPAALLGCHS